jgi:hypothetical protein
LFGKFRDRLFDFNCVHNVSSFAVREFMEHLNFIVIIQYIEDVNVSEVNQHFIFVFKMLNTGLKDFESRNTLSCAALFKVCAVIF